jgi:AcrR family transcriptional regulator
VRVSEETKERTRRRILRTAARLFRRRGFDDATTRDVARAAGVGAGTLFNYYPSKEALALALVARGLERGRRRFRDERRPDASLAEDLFLLAIAALRELEPWRSLVAGTAATAFSPATRGAGAADAERRRHLEEVGRILASHGRGDAPEGPSLQLWWALFLGVLASWAEDPSPAQEDTLALLDRATRMFAASMIGDGGEVHRA